MPGIRRLSIHTRLFLGFAAVLLLSGTLMVATVYLGMRYLPAYDLATPGFRAPRSAGDLPSPPLVEPPVDTYADTKAVRSKEDVWATVLTVSVLGATLVAALGLLAGWLLSRRLLAPLHTINQAAARAGEGDLAYRINAQGPADELRQLADTFDHTLARLERSFEAHQRFAANASHELLTPLASTRTALQVAAQDDSGTELAWMAPRLRAANDRSIEIVHGLLQLAGAEHARPGAEPVDLAALTGQVCAELAPQAEAAGLTLETDLRPCHPVAGNTALLRQLPHNLLANALAYNTPHGWVHAAVHAGGEALTLEVSNSGPSVDPQHADRLFEPFYRASPRVRSDRTGHGLGLAITRAIVQAHHGTITATARPEGGLVVRADFPAGTRT